MIRYVRFTAAAMAALFSLFLFPAVAGAATLTASDVTATSAKLTLTGHHTNWYYGGDVNCTQVSSQSDTPVVTGLTPGTQYTVRAYSGSGCPGSGIWLLLDSVTFTTQQATLTVTNINATGATLNLGSYSGNWYYKHTVPSTGTGATCSSTAVTGNTKAVTGLTANTAYTYKAYSDSGCSTVLATASSFTTPAVSKVTGVTVTAGDRSLSVSWNAESVTGYYVEHSETSSFDNAQSQHRNVNNATITNLVNGTTYYVRVQAYKQEGGGTSPPKISGAWSNTVNGTPSNPQTLTVTNVGVTTATLNIANHTGNWYYKHTGTAASCSSVVTENTKNVSGLTANTAYIFKAYSDSTCSTVLATASSFNTKPSKVTGVTVTASNRSLLVSWDSQADVDGYEVQYKLGNEQSTSPFTKVSGITTDSTTVAVLDNDTLYTLQVRSYKGTNFGEWSDTGTGTPTSGVAKVTGVTVTADDQSLSVSWNALSGVKGYEVFWKSGQEEFSDSRKKDAQTNTSATIDNLTNYSQYTLRVRAYVGTTSSPGYGEWSDTVTGTPTAAALTVSDIEATSATLNLSDHSGDWYYKHILPTTGSGASCSSVVTASTKNVSDLTANTTYTYKAYIDNMCTAEIATASSFVTYPEKVTGVTVTAGNQSLTVNWDSQTGIVGYLVHWKSGTEEFDYTDPSRRQTVTTGPPTTISDLNNGTEYTLVVRSYSGGTTTLFGKDSDAETGTPVAPTSLGQGPGTSPTGKPAVIPPAPGAPAVQGGNRQVTLRWTSGGDGGSAITKWQYAKKAGDNPFETAWTDMPGSGGDTRTHTVTGLTNGTAYRFRVRAVNAVGAGAASPASAAVMPSAGFAGSPRLRQLNVAIGPEFARAMTSGAVDALRLRLDRRSSREPSALSSMVSTLAPRSEALEAGEITLREALGGASFVQSLTGDGGVEAGLTAWGVADWRHLSGGGESGRPWEGDVGDVHLGLDTRYGDGLVGGLLSLTEGTFDYTDRSGGTAVQGTYEASMRSVSPYMAWLLEDGFQVWGMLGHGTGEVVLDDGEEGRQAGDGKMRLAAAGGIVDVMPGVSVKADVTLGRFEVEGNGDRLGGIEVDTQRLRLAVRGERGFAPAGGDGELTASAEVGVRWDGGDGGDGGDDGTEVGLEAGGGIGYSVPTSGLRMELLGRTLVSHEGDVEEWGASGLLQMEPGTGGRGASFSLGLGWGEAGGGLERLWTEGLRDAGTAEGRVPMRLETEGGYGLAMKGSGGLLTPYVGLGLSGGEKRTYRIGVRLTHGQASEMRLESRLRESGVDGPDHALRLDWRLRW